MTAVSLTVKQLHQSAVDRAAAAHRRATRDPMSPRGIAHYERGIGGHSRGPRRLGQRQWALVRPADHPTGTGATEQSEDIRGNSIV